MIPIVAAHDPFRNDLSPRTVRRAAAALVTTLVEALPPAASARAGGIAAELARRLSRRPTARLVEGLDLALVLVADHGLAASTLAARVAANTRAPVYSSVQAAIAALQGPRHGFATPWAEELLTEVATGRSVDVVVEEHLRRGRVALVLRLRSGWRSARRAAARGDACAWRPSTRTRTISTLLELRRAARDAAGGRRVRLCSVCARLRPRSGEAARRSSRSVGPPAGSRTRSRSTRRRRRFACARRMSDPIPPTRSHVRRLAAWSSARRRRRSGSMHVEPPILVLPNAWDVASAKALAALDGCRALATSSAAVARSLGFEDGERAPGAVMVEAAGRIAQRGRRPGDRRSRARLRRSCRHGARRLGRRPRRDQLRGLDPRGARRRRRAGRRDSRDPRRRSRPRDQRTGRHLPRHRPRRRRRGARARPTPTSPPARTASTRSSRRSARSPRSCSGSRGRST